MDNPTRVKAEARLRDLEQQRMKAVLNVAAIDGAMGELRRLLGEPAAGCECGGDCAGCEGQKEPA